MGTQNFFDWRYFLERLNSPLPTTSKEPVSKRIAGTDLLSVRPASLGRVNDEVHKRSSLAVIAAAAAVFVSVPRIEGFLFEAPGGLTDVDRIKAPVAHCEHVATAFFGQVVGVALFGPRTHQKSAADHLSAFRIQF